MLEPTPLYGGNAAYLEDVLYERYLADPSSVPARWREYFDRLAPRAAVEYARGPVEAGIAARARAAARAAEVESGHSTASAKQAAVSRLIQIWTNRGHLVANLDPLGLMRSE